VSPAPLSLSLSLSLSRADPTHIRSQAAGTARHAWYAARSAMVAPLAPHTATASVATTDSLAHMLGGVGVVSLQPSCSPPPRAQRLRFVQAPPRAPPLRSARYFATGRLLARFHPASPARRESTRSHVALCEHLQVRILTERTLSWSLPHSERLSRPPCRHFRIRCAVVQS
jgi:hypothetical protein